VLIQPATVDRWHREGLRRCWRRSRRPGRPRIDSTCRDLIRRMAAENCLWGAPRIHGELLKLGITVSERTVSRYLRDRPTIRSQTWRTFLPNHLGQFTFILPETSLHASSADHFIGPTCRPTWLSRAVLGVPHERAVVDWRASLHRTSPGKHTVQHYVRDRTATQNRGGRGPYAHTFVPPLVVSDQSAAKSYVMGFALAIPANAGNAIRPATVRHDRNRNLGMRVLHLPIPGLQACAVQTTTRAMLVTAQ
jgi:hypothetical protein